MDELPYAFIFSIYSIKNNKINIIFCEIFITGITKIIKFIVIISANRIINKILIAFIDNVIVAQ
jgi:hypothetical protein